MGHGWVSFAVGRLYKTLGTGRKALGVWERELKSGEETKTGTGDQLPPSWSFATNQPLVDAVLLALSPQ